MGPAERREQELGVAELHFPGSGLVMKCQSPGGDAGSTRRALHSQQPAGESLSPAQGCRGGERDEQPAC